MDRNTHKKNAAAKVKRQEGGISGRHELRHFQVQQPQVIIKQACKESDLP